MTALGDMGWYSMRAVVEYLRPTGKISVCTTVAQRDLKTTAVLRAAGVIAFADGSVSTFDIGYTAGDGYYEPPADDWRELFGDDNKPLRYGDNLKGEKE